MRPLIGHLSKAPSTWASGATGAGGPRSASSAPSPVLLGRRERSNPGDGDRSRLPPALLLRTPRHRFWQLRQRDFSHLFTLMYLAITQKGF